MSKKKTTTPNETETKKVNEETVETNAPSAEAKPVKPQKKENTKEADNVTKNFLGYGITRIDS